MLGTKSPKNSNQVDLSRSRFYELRLESGERDRKRNTLAFNDTWFEKGGEREREREEEGKRGSTREREMAKEYHEGLEKGKVRADRSG